MVAPRNITVCQLLHSLNVGGAEMLAARLARRLRGSIRFVFACLDDIGPLGEELRKDGFPVYRLDRKPGFDWRCSLRLSRLIRAERVDVVHAHQYGPFLYAATARLSRRQTPILFTEHGRHQPDFPRRKRIVANRLLASRYDRVVGVGAAVRDALIANEGFSPSRVEVLYNGIDVAAFSRAVDRESARRALQVADSDFVVLQVARLDYLKDHGTALRTMARLASSAPHARLVLIGEGPEQGAIEKQIKSLQLDKSVRLLGSRADVDRLLPGADAFLLTSLSEGIPLTVLEAMAARLPVVGTDVGGMREVVVDGTTGYLCHSGDDASLAERLLRLVHSPDMRQRFGDAGHHRAKELFDESRMSADYYRIYRELSARASTDGRPSPPASSKNGSTAASVARKSAILIGNHERS